MARAIPMRCRCPPDTRQTALPDQGVVAMRHGADEIVRVGELGGFDDLCIGRVGAPVGDVRLDGAVKQHRVLQHKTDLLAQGFLGELQHIDAVNQYPALVSVVKARNQSHHGGLPAPGGAHHTQLLAGVDGEVHALEHRRRRVVAKGDIFECDRAFRRFQFPGIGAVLDDIVGVEDALDALQRDRRLGYRIGILRQILHGLEEFAQVGEKHRQRAHRHDIFEDERSAAPQHHGRAQRHHDRDDG